MTVRKCSYCDSHFTKIEHLKRHERSHTGEKPFKCRKCGKKFARSDVLCRHMRGHSGQVQLARSGDEPRDAESQQSSSPAETPSPPVVQFRNDSNNLQAEQSKKPRPASVLNDAGNRALAASDMGIQRITQESTIIIYDAELELNHLSGGHNLISDTDSFTAMPVEETPLDLHFVATMQGEGASSGLLTFSPIRPLPVRETSLCSTFSTDLTNSPPVDVVQLDEVSQDRRICRSNRENLLSQSAPSSQQEADHDPFTLNDMHFNWLGNLEMDDTLASNLDQHPSNQFRLPSIDDDEFCSKHAPRSGLGSDIPDERFAKVANLWYKKNKRPWRLIQTLWSNVTSYDAPSLFSDRALAGVDSQPRHNDSVNFMWGMDEETRLLLMEEFAYPRSSTNSSNTRFPSADTLDMCIDLYFQRFHILLPFIHPPTFSARNVDRTVVFPLCLIGLYLLDPRRSRTFVIAHLSRAMDRCVGELARTWSEPGSISLCTLLASSFLLLCCASIIPSQLDTEHTRGFYITVLTAAREHGLFESSKNVPPLKNPESQNDLLAWSAWSRVESAKRLIACLIMIDSFFSSRMGTAPIIRTETLRFFLPSSKTLFGAMDESTWFQLVRDGQSIQSHLVDFGEKPIILPQLTSPSILAMQTLLASVWIRITDFRFRTMKQDDFMGFGASLFPCREYLDGATGTMIAPLLLDMYTMYQHELKKSNPNCLAFWHCMCIALTANLELFEVAAGREGIDAAKLALEKISVWAQTPTARQACLHAAQAYLCMSQRMISDGTMFMSEIALFNSALVLGLYLYVSPTQLSAPDASGTLVIPFELLDDVDWRHVGEQTVGLDGGGVGKCKAQEFISKGGPVLFAGSPHQGGFSSARRIILKFLGLLEEVGRWNVQELCQILRVLSDSMIELA